MTILKAESPGVAEHPRFRAGSRLAFIDGLRLAAALFVVLYHLSGHEAGVKGSLGMRAAEAFPVLYRFTSYGWMGVELFFMISGFVICMSSWGRTPGEFFRSRIVRLFPAYWPAVLITAAVLTFWPVVEKAPSLDQVLINLTMIHEPAKVAHVDSVYWTLWAEARFYLLFAVVLLWRGLTLQRTLYFGYGWLIASVVATGTQEPVIAMILQPRDAAYFIAGIAFYLIYRFGGDLRTWGLVAASFLVAQHSVTSRLEGVSGFLRRDLNPMIGLLLLVVFFLLLTAIAQGWTSWIKWRWLTTAGLLTYPLYLLHENIGWVIMHGLRNTLSPFVNLTVVVVLMLLASWLLHKIIEKPLARWMKAKLSPPKPPAPVEPAPPVAPSGSGAGAATTELPVLEKQSIGS
jgi:peptidoglycan/LPS O-acetylase OafA/YrhL